MKESGLSARQVSINLGLPPQIVERWIKELDNNQEDAFPGNGQPKSSIKINGN